MKLYYLPIICYLLFQTTLVAQTKQHEWIKSWKNILLYQKTEGINASGFRFNYLQNKKSIWKDWLIPLSIGFSHYKIDRDRIEKKGFHDVDINGISVGYTGFRPIKNNLYLNLSLNATLGNERLTEIDSSNSRRFIFGTSPSQSIYFIPKSKYGFVFGIGVYEIIQTSKVFSFDIGLRLNAGIKF